MHLTDAIAESQNFIRTFRTLSCRIAEPYAEFSDQMFIWKLLHEEIIIIKLFYYIESIFFPVPETHSKFLISLKFLLF
jgi:hypothetical protein